MVACSYPAFSQTTNAQNDADEIEKIQVVGTRGSLSRALATKKMTLGVVDSISAENLGQFPDQNVAESLQRVSGVSIDRSGGEGRSITVRGLGPEFNTVLLNGRLLATDNPGREFSFDILPSELISGADVFKSSAANFQEGGIGSTVIINTARPLDHKGLVVAGKVGGKYDSGSENTTPTGSILVSNSNEDGTFGILGSLIYDQRDAQIDRYTASGWLTGKNLDFDKDGADDVTGVAVPRSFNQQVDISTRKRVGGTAAIDWTPSDTITVQLDALYTKYDVDSQVNTLAYFTDESDIIGGTFDNNGTATSFERSNTGSLATDWVVDSKPRESSTMQIGANVNIVFSDSTSAAFDLSHSEANGNDLDTPFFVLGSRNTGLNPSWDHTQGTLVPIIDNVISPTDTSDLRGHFGFKRGNKVKDTVDQFSIDAITYIKDSSLSSVEYGFLMTEREKTNLYAQTPDSILCYYCGYGSTVPASIAQEFNAGNFLGESQLASTWLTYDPQDLIEYYISEAAIAQKGDAVAEQEFRDALAANSGDWRSEYKPGSSGTVTESSWAAYIQGNWEGEIGDMWWDMSAGVRYVDTNVSAEGSSVQLLELNTIPGDATALVPVFSDIVPVKVETDYDYFLPSVSFRLNLDDDKVVRFSSSRTLTRPTLTNLSTAQNYGIRPPTTFTRSGGNPELNPYLAWNYDLGFDYFINDASYVSVAAFYKKIENFVSQVTQPVEILGKTFQDTKPTNAETANVYGVETSVQYTFDSLPAPWNGSGISANYTKVDSDVTFDPTLTTQVFNVEGLSDSANLVLFLETDDFTVRAAYNWRDTFLLRTFGAEGQPESVKSYGQIDLTTSYKLTKNFTAYIDLLNIGNEKTSSFQSYQERVLAIEETGRRVTFGVRAIF